MSYVAESVNIQKVIFDHVSFIAKTQYEVVVSILAVILHDMPQNRMITDWHHRLWNILGVIANARTQAAAK